MSQSIEVVVRLRPSSRGGIGAEDEPDHSNQPVSIDESSGKVTINRIKNKGQAEYKFTHVFGPDTDQLAVYSSCDVISHVLDGVNCCVMTYGQTSTGKTYTMYGKGWEDCNSLGDTLGKGKDSLSKSISLARVQDIGDNESIASAHDSGDDVTVQAEESIENSDHLGIIPRSINDLFTLLNNQRSSKEGFAYSISLQIMQIYNEKIYDLLHDKKRQNPLVIRETSAKDNFGSNVYVRGLSVYRIDSQADAFRLIKKAIRNKAVRSTELNAVSSRSHTVLQLFVMTEESDADGLKIVRRSTLSLIDLAGSEKWRSSLSTTGSIELDAQVKEMTNINTSLHTLGNCIAGLIESDRKHIPYRDSVLTRLLQSTLGGNGRSIIVATIHGDQDYLEETYSTLQFATRASKVKVQLAANVGINEKMSLADAQRHIKVLRKQLEALKADPSKAVASQDTTAVCEQCRNHQSEAVAWKKRIQVLEDENAFLKQKLEEMSKSYNNSAFPSNQSSVESSPVIKSSKKKKKSTVDSQKASLKDPYGNGIDPQQVRSAELSSIAEEGEYMYAGSMHDDVQHGSFLGPFNDKITTLNISYDRAMMTPQPQQKQGLSSNNSSISGLDELLHGGSQTTPSALAAAALKAVSDFTRSLDAHQAQPLPQDQANTAQSAHRQNSPLRAKKDRTTLAPLERSPSQEQKSHQASQQYQQSTSSGTSHLESSVSGNVLGLPQSSPAYTQANAATFSSIMHQQEQQLPATNNGGVCQKHNLEDCILCSMFGSKPNRFQDPNTNNSSVLGASYNTLSSFGSLLGGGDNTYPQQNAPQGYTSMYSSTSTAALLSSAFDTSAKKPSAFATTSTSAANAHRSGVSSTVDDGDNDESSHLRSSFERKAGNPFTRESLTSSFNGTLVAAADNNNGSSNGKSSSSAISGNTCKSHGLTNCLLCNGVPSFEFDDYNNVTDYGNSNSNKAYRYDSSSTPSQLRSSLSNSATNQGSLSHSKAASTGANIVYFGQKSTSQLPPMTLSESTSSRGLPTASNGTGGGYEMISTLDSPALKSSFALSASSTSTTATSRDAQLVKGKHSNVAPSSSFSSFAEATEDGNESNRTGSGRSKRVQQIQAISQFRQPVDLLPVSHTQHNKLYPRSSSSPLPVTSNPIVPNHLGGGGHDALQGGEEGGGGSVRGSLVKKMRAEVQQHEATAQNPLQQHVHSHGAKTRYQEENEDEDEDDDQDGDDADNEQDRYPNGSAKDQKQHTVSDIVPLPKKKVKKVKKKKVKKSTAGTAGSDTDGSSSNKFDLAVLEQQISRPGSHRVINHRTVALALQKSKKK